MVNLETLNPGIRNTVRFLLGHEFNTCDSGDGKTHEFKCDQPNAYVHIQVEPEELVSEANRLRDVLDRAGVTVLPLDEQGKVPTIEASYNPANEFAVITLWNVDDELMLYAGD